MSDSSEATLRDEIRSRTRGEDGRRLQAHQDHPPLSERLAGDRRGFLIRRLSVITDMATLAAVGALSVLALTLAGRPLIWLDGIIFLLFIPVWPLIGALTRAYHPHAVGRGLSVTISDEFAAVFRVATMWSWFMIVARTLAIAEPIQLLPSLLIWATSIPAVLMSRSLLRHFSRKHGWFQQRVLVIGRECDAAKVIVRIRRHPEWGLVMMREIDVASNARIDAAALVLLAEGENVSRVIFATPPDQLDARTDLTRAFIEAGAQVDFVPGEAEILRSGAEISALEGLPLMSMPGAKPPRSVGLLKRCMDLAIAVPALILASPLIAVAALRIRRDSPGPVFYKQRRAGLDGCHFDFLKLRTMSVDAEDRLAEVKNLGMHGDGADSGMFKAVEDPRVTQVGAGLRLRSLDELPQLWNVVKGDMSLVGPRPLPIAEDNQVTGHYVARRYVRPGMTGAWQVNGRSDIPFEGMLRLDYSYVLNWSLSYDIKLLVQTVDAVFRGRGAY